MHLYLHVPFCARRCSYCDFAIAVRRVVPSEGYADAILCEWDLRQEDHAWRGSSRIDTIYFGGGTPSLLEPAALERILAAFGRRREIAGDAELTLEANPDDVTTSRAADWHRLGINRISLGAQSFNPDVLRWMHRTHSAADVPRAVETLRRAGIANLSLDLIFGLDPALRRDWGHDLTLALSLEPSHLSLYGLTVEERTPLARWVVAGTVRPADEDRYAREFLEADARLTEAEFEHYEVSNYARAGFRSRHNSAYWERRPFLGLGPSAHSGSGTRRRWNIREWAAYQRAIAAGQDPVEGTEDLDPAAVSLEDRYLGLRTNRGIPAATLGPAQVEAWTTAGWARASAGRVVLTPEGWLRMDAMTVSGE
ncbi:MAG: radical SAM family heme chaperone HemW [Gemmatimonadales bacterium]